MQDIIFLEKYSRTWSTNRWKSRWRKICRAFSLRCGQMRRSFMRYRSARPPGKCGQTERWKTGVCLYFRADKSQHRLPADGQAAGKPAYLFTFFKRSAGDLDDQRVSAEHCDRGLQYVASHAEFYEWKCFFPAVKSESYDHRAG